MAERTVSVGLQARVTGFVAGMRTAQKSATDFATNLDKHVHKNRAAINDLANTTGLIGAGMVAAAAIAVKSFADFDSAMSNVRAATHASAADMNLLRDAALKAGAETAFSATEAASAIENLAKAGVSTADILAGGLDGALSLAAAGNIEVADAAEIAATAMTQFKLSGDDIPHVADLLAAAAGKAQGEVGDMAMALKQGGLVAAQMGLSIEETTGTLAAFASAGLLGSDAGTSFKTMLLRLANPSAEAASTLAELGIAAYDAQGNFVGMASLAGQLHQALSPLPQAQRDAALATIFGSDAIRSASILYQQGAKGITNWTNKVDDAGFAAETAAIKMDNLRGDIEEFLGSLETALIGAGEGADGPLRSLVQRATEAVNAFSELPAPIQQSVLALVGGGGLVLLGVAGMAKLVVGISDARNSMKDLGITSAHAGRLLKAGLAAGVILGIAQGIDMLADKVQGLDASTSDLGRSFREWNRQGKLSGDLAKLVGEDFNKLADAADLVFDPGLKKRVDDFATSLVFADSEIDNARQRFDALDETLAGLDPELAAKGFDRIRDALVDQGFSVKQINSLFPKYRDAVKTAGEQASETATATADATVWTERYGEVSQDTAAQVEDLEREASELLETLNAVSDINLDLVESQIQFRNGLRDMDDQVKENGKSFRANTRAGDANREMLNGMIRDSKAAADAVFEKTKRDKGAEAAGKAWNGVMARNIGALLKEADRLGLNSRETRKYIANILGIPVKSLTKFTTPGLARALDRARRLDNEADALDNRVVTTVYESVYVTNRSAASRVRGRQILGPAAGGLVADYEPLIPMARGGRVSGPGGPRDDTAGLFALSNGEFVVNSAATKANLPLLKAINSGNKMMGMMAAGWSGGGYGRAPINVENLNVRAYSDRFSTRQVMDDLAMHGVA